LGAEDCFSSSVVLVCFQIGDFTESPGINLSDFVEGISSGNGCKWNIYISLAFVTGENLFEVGVEAVQFDIDVTFIHFFTGVDVSLSLGHGGRREAVHSVGTEEVIGFAFGTVILDNFENFAEIVVQIDSGNTSIGILL